MRDRPSPDAPYPRRIEHAETVEYGYDPASGTYSADVQESSRPEVVGYDDSPPDPLEREVGGWEVTPSGRRVESDENDDPDIPDDIADDLREQAQQEGAPVTRTATTAYEHDLDTQATRTHSATDHDPLGVLDDDDNDNPEPGAEPRERPAAALDVLSDSAIDSLAPGEGEKKKPTDDAPDTSEMAKRVMARQASGHDAPVSADVLRLQKLIAQQMEQQAAAQSRHGNRAGRHHERMTG